MERPKKKKSEKTLPGRKKKLLITGSTFPRWENDTEPRFILDLAKELNNYYDVTVLTPAAVGAVGDEILEGVHVHRFHYFPIHSLETLCSPGAIVSRIKEKKSRVLLVPFLLVSYWGSLLRYGKKSDFVQANWFIPQGIMQSFFNFPYMVTGHGADVALHNAGVMKKLKLRCVKKASAVTFVSQALKNTLYGLEGFDDPSFEEKTTVCPLGVDTEEFSPANRIENYFNQGTTPVVLFVGRLVERKGVQYLIEAMEGLNAKLVIVGKGTYEEELRKKAEHFGSQIVFLGPRTHEELKYIYPSADVLCVPSVQEKDGVVEGFGLVTIEAMASGLPVIGSNSGGIKEVIVSGENGYLVEERDSKALHDKLEELTQNPQRRAEMKENVLQTADHYSFKNIGKIYGELIQNAMDSSQSR